MIGSHDSSQQRHSRFVRRPIPLAVVAGNARRHKVFPCIFSPTGLGNNMIDGERHIVAAAVLTPVTVAAENILPGEDDLLVWDADIEGETYYTRERHTHGNGPDLFPIARFDQLRFAEIKQDDGLLNIAYTQRLITLVEDEHLAAEFSIASYVMRAEDEYTSFEFGEFVQLIL